MPMDRSLYPPNWETFSAHIRFVRALHRCECTGECGLHQPNPEPRRCQEVNRQFARWFNGLVVLTTAHLCDCYPLCAIESHVKAMCQRCHLRVDRFRHAAARVRTQATAAYRAKRYRSIAREIHIEDLHLLATLPQRKRTRRWTGL